MSMGRYTSYAYLDTPSLHGKLWYSLVTHPSILSQHRSQDRKPGPLKVYAASTSTAPGAKLGRIALGAQPTSSRPTTTGVS